MAAFIVLCCKIYVHIWKRLNACMLCTVIQLSSRSLKTVKFVSAENCKYTTKYIHMCVRPHVGLSPNPRSDGWAPQWMCVCTLPLLTDRSHWQSRWRLQPCDPQARLRTNMTQAAYRRGGGPSGAAAGQLVCMSMFMEYAFMLAHKSWTCSPPSISRVSSYRGEQSGFFSILLWYCTVSLVQNLKTHFVKTHRFLQSCILQVINVQVLYCENTFFN